jgi:uncharacterized integral membrane protein
MIRRVINWLVLLPVAIVSVVVAVANRAPVTVSLDPFGRELSSFSFSAPLFAVILLAMMLGVVIGGFAVWWKQGRYRRRCRLAESELSAARADVERLRQELGRGTAAEATGGPLAFFNRPAA